MTWLDARIGFDDAPTTAMIVLASARTRRTKSSL
jgi:hypothetical protein